MMIRSKVLLAVLGIGILGGVAACNHESGQASLAPATGGSSNALVFSDDGSNAKLALADQPAALMLECAHGSRTVHVTHASVAGPAEELVLVSDGSEAPMKADRQAFEGQTLVLGETPLDAPALDAFRKSGRLSVHYGGEGLTADAHPEAFFAACSKAA